MKSIGNRIGALEESISPKNDPLADEMARVFAAECKDRLKDMPPAPELSPEEKAEIAIIRDRLREKAV